MSNNRGFIIFAMLIFMQVYFLLGLTALENSLRAEKLNAYKKIRREALNEGGLILRYLANEWRDSLPTCLFSPIPLRQLQKKSLGWWNTTCAGNFGLYQYHYMMENLGLDSCAFIQNEEGQVANYYRVTLVLTKNESQEKILLQTIMIKATLPTGVCASKPHYVNKGFVFMIPV